MSLDLAATLAALPPLGPAAAGYRAAIRDLLRERKNTLPVLVVLDDDPTGTQTCHDIAVLTVWDVPTLTAEFARDPAGFFILTNTRALHPAPARERIATICANLQRAAGTRAIEIVLRGDSTLRGHFPLEPEAVASVLGAADAWLLCPFFLQGGRYTVDDVHYVAEGNVLVPAAATPFAKDATFGYRSSNLREYVVEKSRGAIPAERIDALSLATIRNGGPDAVQQQLAQLPRQAADGKPSQQPTVVVVNAAAEEDVDAVVLALLRTAAEGNHGPRFLYRTGAAFVSARLGIAPIPPITAHQLGIDGAGAAGVGGLVVAGSYVPKTTAQLRVLTERSGDRLTTVVLDVNELLREQKAGQADKAAPAVTAAVAVADAALRRGQDVLVMTSRDLIVGADEAASLDIGATVARALVAVVQALPTRPRYVVAKGGITSSDLATDALGVRRALIVGQAAPGVPLWRCDEPTCKWPGVPYVVFPGNVGGDSTLYEVVDAWRPKA
ncbi:hypothetical protein SPI_06379 [Niveomyces insectorum RCEF 264]|uniref:Uncharacterized protein n=1 Tax=Niveomyces insectorum RCEF 264 TaxID=1081102 RepID=A0A167S2Y0_9HYPO|nr:hypothetical protein SPI_06379 [Niveomyces insectorum RCEF 264]